MSKRPLWTAFLIWVVILLVLDSGGFLKREPPPSWLKEGNKIRLEGQIYRQEWKEKTILLYLNQITVKSDSDFKFSKHAVVSIKEKKQWQIGSKIEVYGTVSMLEEASNWGEFDQKSYYEQQKVELLIQNGVVEKILRPPPLSVSVLETIKQSLKNSIDRVNREKDAAILNAMILGEKGELKAEQKKSYQNGGISHILAISGLHISLLGLALYRFLRRIGLSFWISGIFGMAVMGSYAIMTGMSVSAVRAVIMFFTYLGAEILGQTYDALSSLSLAGIILLAMNPEYLKQAGFLLSFGAVMGLSIVLPQMETTWKKEKENFAKKTLRASLCVSLSTLPISLWFFCEYSVFGLALNLFVIPTVQIVMGSAIAGMAAGLFSRTLGIICSAPAHYLLSLYEKAANFAVELPFGIWRTGRPNIWQIVCYYGCLFVFLALIGRISKKWKKTAWVIGVVLLIGIIGKIPDHRLAVTVLDVGQGDGICIQNGEKGVYLIDGGSSSKSGIGAYCIESYLKFEGISKIKGWFVTHTDLDHISGLLEILQSYQPSIDGRNKNGVSIETIFLPYRKKKTESYLLLEKLAKRNGIEVYCMESGKKLTEGTMEIVCLAPSENGISGEENSDSMVLMLRYKSFKALFTGDLEGTGEKLLIRSGLLEQVDVLKVAHHGSEFSTTKEFLQQTCPRLAIISCAKDNRYGHPHEELLFRLYETNTEIKMTKDSGAIQILTDGTRHLVAEKKKGETA